MYEVWAADLNSLYDQKPRSEVLIDRVSSRKAARDLVKTTQRHDIAAWYFWEEEMEDWSEGVQIETWTQ